jgi:hypothetical protein
MRGQTALKIVIGLCVLSAVGLAIPLWRGVSVNSIARILADLWIVAAILLFYPIAKLFASRAGEIALIVALASAVVCALSIYWYSTEHVALSLGMMGTFWWLAANLLSGRGALMHRSLGGVFNEFKAGKLKPLSPLARTLQGGSAVLFAASIVCLFTITTW